MSIYHFFFLNKESNFPKCVKSENNQQTHPGPHPPHLLPKPKNTVTCLTSNGFPNGYPDTPSSLHHSPFHLGIPTGALIEPLAAAEPVPSSLPPRLKELLPPHQNAVDGTLSYSPKDQRAGQHASDSNTLDWKNLVLVKNPGLQFHFMRILGPKQLCQPARSFPTSDQTSSATP